MSVTPTTPVTESDRNKRTAKRILAIFLPLCLVGGVGFGYAYWTSLGGGSGSATANPTTNNLTLLATAATGLYPGADLVIPIKATNTNGYRVALNNVTAGAITSSDSVACDPTTNLIGASIDPITGPVFVPANAGVGAVPTATVGTLHITMTDSDTVNQSACRNKSFSVVLTVS
ncbi:MAG: hypothetical protein JWP11_2208 [Frankiales bacterium]|nr:hypothetical protein [Frankiales bacterium]